MTHTSPHSTFDVRRSAFDVPGSSEPLVALYRSPGFISWAIRWQTRSEYSHAAIVMGEWEGGDLHIIEAWHNPSGVREGLASALHPGCTPDLYTVQGMSINQMHDARQEARRHLGEKYDFRGVARFVSRVPYRANHRWFCSELVAHCCALAGVRLLHAEPHKLAPGHLAWSPLLVKIDSPRRHEEHEEQGTKGRNTHHGNGVSLAPGDAGGQPYRTADGSVVSRSLPLCPSCLRGESPSPADGRFPLPFLSSSLLPARRQGLLVRSAGVPPASLPSYNPQEGAAQTDGILPADGCTRQRDHSKRDGRPPRDEASTAGGPSGSCACSVGHSLTPIPQGV